MSLTPWLVAVVLLALNGFFVAVEFSLVGSRRSRLDELAAGGDAKAVGAVAAVDDLALQLAGAQLGITMASLGLGSVAEPAAVAMIEQLLGPLSLPSGAQHGVAFVIGLGIVVFLHLVVGEMVPKGIALADPERSLRSLVRPNRVYMAVVKPAVRLFNATASGLTRLVFRVEPTGPAEVHSADELALMLAETRDEGLIEEFAHDLLAGVLDFGGRTAGEVLVSPSGITTVPQGATVAEVEAVVVASGHTRVLVLGAGGLDDVLGFVHSKDLLMVEDDVRDRRLSPRLIRRMLLVPTDRTLEDLLRAMRQTRVHLALVQDGERTAGIVTLEDLLEELVGDILDESDRS